MMHMTRIGGDVAKQLVQVHGVNNHAKVVVRKQLPRGKMRAFLAQRPPCLRGMEAGASAHSWAREWERLGPTVRLLAPQFVPPYRQHPTNDGNEADAICAAVSRPTRRFVPLNSVAHQAVLTVHRARTRLVAERTALVQQMRGFLADYGLVGPQGIARWRRAFPGLLADADNGLPLLARELIAAWQARRQDVDQRMLMYARRSTPLAQQSDAAQRLLQVAGGGAVTATAIVAPVGTGTVFQKGRPCAAWLGRVPRQSSTGGQQRLGHMRKRGEVSLRPLLIPGARRGLQCTGKRLAAQRRWAERLQQRRGNNMAAGARAAQHARLLWA
jgi:transposase